MLNIVFSFRFLRKWFIDHFVVGAEYTVRLYNHSSKDIMANLVVDGVETLGGWDVIVHAHDYYEFKGFSKGNWITSSFQFAPLQVIFVFDFLILFRKRKAPHQLPLLLLTTPLPITELDLLLATYLNVRILVPEKVKIIPVHTHPVSRKTWHKESTTRRSVM